MYSLSVFDTQVNISELKSSLTASQTQLCGTQQDLEQLRERYAAELEEIAAVRASLEDLTRTHSDLQESQKRLAEREMEVTVTEQEVRTRLSENE